MDENKFKPIVKEIIKSLGLQAFDVRYLEANKALPDKHRFLLFEKMREVELVWTGD
ncbi:MAG: hypothetical protein AB1585_18495 [Thermodesulfobacteriota bacterium]